MKLQNLISFFRVMVLLSATVFLVACGDDPETEPDTTNNDPQPTALVTDSNAAGILMSTLQSIQVKAGANEAIDYLTAQIKIIAQGGNFTPPPGFTLCNGSVLPTPSGNSIDFIDLCVTTPDGIEIVLSGSVIYEINALESVTVKIENLAIQTPDNTYLLSLNVSVSKDAVSFSMTLTDLLGVEISTASLEVTGGVYTGITAVHGSISVANYGTVNVSMLETDPLIFDCTGNNVPSSGTIEITGSDDSSASITFNNCESYTVTVNGVPGSPVFW